MHNYTIHGVLTYLLGENEPVLVQSDQTPPPYYGDEADNYRLQPEPVTMQGETYHAYTKPLGVYLLAERYRIALTDADKQLIDYLSRVYNRNIAFHPTGFDDMFRDAERLTEYNALWFMRANGIVAPDEKNWRAMFESLHGGYISGASLAEFNAVMNHHTPLNGNRIVWNGTPATGLYFFKILGFSTKEVKRCFESRSGKPFSDNNCSSSLPEHLAAILRLIP